MKRQIFGFLALCLCAGTLHAQDLPKTDIPIERFYQYPLIQGRSPAAAAMSPNGKMIVFGWNQTGDRKLDVWMMDYPSGKKKQIIDANKIEPLPRQDDTRTELEKKEELEYDGGIAGFHWAPDSKEILFSYKGRAWTCAPDGSNLQPVFDAAMGISSLTYSPDGKYLGFIRSGNVFRMDRKNGRVKQLTFVSKPKTQIDGYSWSPDGKNLVVSWSDSSSTGTHQMMDFSKDRAKVVNIERDWVGESPANVQIGVIPVDGGLIRFVSDIPRYIWTSGLEWSPDSQTLALGWYKEDFQEWTISTVPLSTLKKTDIYHEVAPKNYLPDFRPLLWSKDSRNIIFGTDVINGKFANRSVMSIGPEGKNLTKVFAKDYDVASISRPKDSDRLVLITLGKSPLQTEIQILEPNGKVTQHDVIPDGFDTPKQFDDVSTPLFSDDGKQIATLASSRTLNSELYSVEPSIKRLTESQTPLFKKVDWADFKEVTFDAPDGKTIHGLLITKKGLDPSQKHPALVSNIYANTAKEAWGGFFENYMASQLDMVVLLVDFRASWGYGGEFNSGYYKSMGIVDTDEAVAAKNYLATLPYVRSDRVGIWGWSYGGFLTLKVLLNKPGVFDAGVAVAPVTDWKIYNEWYTRRRLGLPKDDKDDIYKKTSPVYDAAGLQDHLLLIHGVLDDNVLFDDTGRMVQAFIDNGKYFDLMIYPRDDHGIGRTTSSPHVFGTIARYLYRELYRP